MPAQNTNTRCAKGRCTNLLLSCARAHTDSLVQARQDRGSELHHLPQRQALPGGGEWPSIDASTPTISSPIPETKT